MRHPWYASRVIQKALIILVVVAASGVVFYMFSDRLFLAGDGKEQASAQTNEALVNDLKVLKDRFNTDLFIDPRFMQLKPYNEVVEVGSADGRDNPFAPPEDVLLEETPSATEEETTE